MCLSSKFFLVIQNLASPKAPLIDITHCQSSVLKFSYVVCMVMCEVSLMKDSVLLSKSLKELTLFVRSCDI